MKRLAFKVIAILFICVFCNSTIISSSTIGDKDYEKIIEKEFSISSDGTVNIDNRYGDVVIHPTANDKVTLEITMKVDKKNKAKAEEFFERVEIEFSNSSSRVSAKTNIENKSGGSWTSWLNPKNWNNNDNYSINYEVWMPSTCKLKLSNRYGDIAVGDMDNDVEIALRYGDGVLEDVKGDVKVDLGYGDIRMGDAEDMELKVRYGEFKCESGHDIELDSKYAEIYIDKASRLECESGYDDYFIGDIDVIINDGGYDDFEIEFVKQFEFDSRYSDYEIDELSGGGVFDSGYGDLKVRNVIDLSLGLDVKGSYSDVWLGIDDLPYSIDIDSKYTDVDVHAVKHFNPGYTYIKDDNEMTIQASKGSGKNSIKARMKYGSFKLR